MRRWFAPLLLVAAIILLSGPVAARAEAPPGAHSSSATVKHDLSAVIDSQLAAFRANDYPKAYSFAATEIRSAFAAGDFEVMVKASYPVIANSVRADYGIAFDTGVEAVINVVIETADKRSAQFQYLLKKEDGEWKISGVAELKPDGLTV